MKVVKSSWQIILVACTYIDEVIKVRICKCKNQAQQQY